MDLTNMLNPSASPSPTPGPSSPARKTRASSKVTKPSTSNRKPSTTATTAATAALRAPPRPKPAESLHAASLRLLQTRAYSDIVLKCEDETFHLHRSIVCPQSDFFSGCMDSGMKESTDGVVTLQEDAVDDVAKMVMFFYTGWYDEASTGTGITDPGDSEEQKDMREKVLDLKLEAVYREYQEDAEPRKRTDDEIHADPLCVNIRLFGMGRKYGIPGLCKLAMEKVKRYVRAVRLEHAGTAGVVGQFTRVLDALELMLEVCDMDKEEEFIDILGRPFAREIPGLIKEAPEKWGQLQERGMKNHALQEYLFFWSNMETHLRLRTMRSEKSRGRAQLYRAFEGLEKNFTDLLERIEGTVDWEVCNDDGCEGEMFPIMSTNHHAFSDGIPNCELLLECQECGRTAEWEEVYNEEQQQIYY
ncbi:hypothetical protein BJ508DRAFT_412403 [Ascobolus immersus RN42]|uniref:BTB domain-containing protein n=1 Tax=Ascobolus immersus RN42 TaxID=1160509 RepID=A0A3N4ILH8_ASCIM|nr:hypothetical protein BJ508DRAFT_412403 [Ascobolus immersus RN42]